MPIGIYIELQNLTADTYAAINARLSDLGDHLGERSTLRSTSMTRSTS